MKNFNSLRRTFVRQTQPDHCGLACLSMILNYVGKTAEADQLKKRSVTSEGISLLALHGLAASFGMPSRCVKMDLDYLSTVPSPTLLHVINEREENHFIVCYGPLDEDPNYFVIGDPARHMSLLSKPELDRIWRSRSALYFEELYFSNGNRFRQLLNYRLPDPIALWVAIPLLNLFAAILGIALSWAIQKATSDFLLNGRQDLIIAVPLLLFILLFFRSLVNYVRQLVLIKFNNGVCEKYLTLLIRLTTRQAGSQFASMHIHLLRTRMADVQKIQSGLTTFITVILSEGIIIILLLSAIFYLDSAAGMLSITGIVVSFVVAGRNSSFFSSNLAYLNDLSATSENALVKEDGHIKSEETVELRAQKHRQNYLCFLNQAKKIARRAGRLTFLYEGISAVTTLLVFSRCLLQMRTFEMPGTNMVLLVISSYLITALTLKICSAWNIIADGKAAYRLFAEDTHKI